MDDDSEWDFAALNRAAEEMGYRLIDFGISTISKLLADHKVDENYASLVLANAQLRAAMASNAAAFNLDAEDLGRRFNEAVKAAAREVSS
jgi:hypothetical protein